MVGVADPSRDQRVVALLSPHDGMGDNETIQESIMARCWARLAKFKIPRTLGIVPDLPRTPTGKMNRAKVREEYLAATRAELSADDRHSTGT